MKQVNKWKTVRYFAAMDLMDIRRAYKDLNYTRLCEFSIAINNYAALHIISQSTFERYLNMRSKAFEEYYKL